MKRIMEEAQLNGSNELPPWLLENRDFRKFLKEAEKVHSFYYLDGLALLFLSLRPKLFHRNVYQRN